MTANRLQTESNAIEQARTNKAVHDLAKLTTIATLDRTISRKTLEILAEEPRKSFFDLPVQRTKQPLDRTTLRLETRQSVSDRGRTHSNESEQARTQRPVQDLPTLTKIATPNLTISSKTLEILTGKPQKSFSVLPARRTKQPLDRTTLRRETRQSVSDRVQTQSNAIEQARTQRPVQHLPTLTKIATPNLTISSKTLEILTGEPRKSFSVLPVQRTKQPLDRTTLRRETRQSVNDRVQTQSNAIEQARTQRPVQHLPKLTKIATPNLTISCKTLEILAEEPQKRFSDLSAHCPSIGRPEQPTPRDLRERCSRVA